jgi:site-specific recombinase XerC
MTSEPPDADGYVRAGIDAAERLLRPEWFAAFLADRGTRKPSPHTMKAYRQDFDAIAALIVGSKRDAAAMSLGELTTEAMRGAFAQYAETHKAASIQRCWSTWNVLCTFLYTSVLVPANPMPLVGRPKIAKTLPKGCPRLRFTRCSRRSIRSPSGVPATGRNAIAR